MYLRLLFASFFTTISTLRLVGISGFLAVQADLFHSPLSFAVADSVNAQLIVDGTLCASFDDSLHEKALDVIESLQVKVIR